MNEKSCLRVTFLLQYLEKLFTVNCLIEKEPIMKVYQHVNIVTCDQDFHVYLDGILALENSQIVYVGQENQEILKQADQS